MSRGDSGTHNWDFHQRSGWQGTRAPEVSKEHKQQALDVRCHVAVVSVYVTLMSRRTGAVALGSFLF